MYNLSYSGDMCEINIDDCAGDPCHNGAYCLDGLNSFTCTCAPGFTGELCEDGKYSTSLFSNCFYEVHLLRMTK